MKRNLSNDYRTNLSAFPIFFVSEKPILFCREWCGKECLGRRYRGTSLASEKGGCHFFSACRASSDTVLARTKMTRGRTVRLYLKEVFLECGGYNARRRGGKSVVVGKVPAAAVAPSSSRGCRVFHLSARPIKTLVGVRRRGGAVGRGALGVG